MPKPTPVKVHPADIPDFPGKKLKAAAASSSID
jgi:hypothetical protein